MSETKTGRGRPKGSGLDDSVQLAAIEKLLAADPTLKPTTAIRKIGVTNPSAVRRLRDKLSAQRTIDPAEAAVPPDVIVQAAKPVGDVPRTSSIACPAMPEAKVKERARVRRAETEVAKAPARKAETTQKSQETKPAESQSAASVSQAPAVTGLEAQSEWLARIGGLGLKAFVASFEFQLAFLGQAMRLPPVTAALKQQLFLNEMTLSFLPGMPTRTLH